MTRGENEMKLSLEGSKGWWVDLERERLGNMAEVAKGNVTRPVSLTLGRFDCSYMTSHPIGPPCESLDTE